MKTAFKEHISQNLPFLEGKKLLVAISGGIDSVVLTHLLQRLHFSISLAHCNFLLRGKESDKDEVFVKKLGEKLQVPTYTTRFETKKHAQEKGISTQMAARELRYQWFDEICSKNNIDYMLTAHHKNDVLETFLINFTRGTGLDGLLGIPQINENIIRPLLPFTQNDIIVYANKKKLQWREDSSNSSIKYTRNKIRHKVVPVLTELNPSLLETFSSTLENIKGSQQIVKDRIQNIQQKIVSKHNREVHFNIAELKKLSNPKIYLFEFLKGFHFTQWDDITNLLNAQTGKQVFSKTHRLLKNREVLILSEITGTEMHPDFQIFENTQKIEIPVGLSFEILKNEAIDLSNNNHTVLLDYQLLEFPLTLRKWQKGDFFFPFGMSGKKKVSKFFKDEKMALTQKESAWILCSQNNIIWIVGKRLDERFKVTNNTQKIFKIKY